jgi:uncharacterized protein (TIGR03118 family)
VRSPGRTARLLDRRPALEALEDRCLLSPAYLQTNLVSDIGGIARFKDTNLVNPWGLAYGPTGPFWVSDNNAGVATLYDGQGTPQSLVVTIPTPFKPTHGPKAHTGTPTGDVFNGGPGFVVSQNGASGPAAFIFVTEDGTIAGWNPIVNLNQAIQVVNNSTTPTRKAGAVYKGAALGTDSDGRTLLYVANFRAGTIEVYDDHFRPTTVGGDFSDPHVPAGFAPFDIALLGGKLYVTYAKQDAAKHDDVAGPGNGLVDVFDTDGHLLSTMQPFIAGGPGSPLNSPWGLAIAPSDFGQFSNDLLVGNFGDGTIHAFDPTTGDFKGTLTDPLGNPIVIGGLWSLKFGNGGQAGPTSTLFFTAGIDDESHGLFGELQAVDITVGGGTMAVRNGFAAAAGQKSAGAMASGLADVFRTAQALMNQATTRQVQNGAFAGEVTRPTFGGTSLAALDQVFVKKLDFALHHSGGGQASLQTALDHTVGVDLSS